MSNVPTCAGTEKFMSLGLGRTLEGVDIICRDPETMCDKSAWGGAAWWCL